METADSVKRKRKFPTGILYLLPALILFTVFLFYPMFRTLYLSFFLTNPKGDPVLFNGIQNYIELFHSKEFLLSLKSSFFICIMHCYSDNHYSSVSCGDSK